LYPRFTPAGDFVIPAYLYGQPVVAIGPRSFYNMGGITRVTIPASVTRIEHTAFMNNSNLTRVTFGAGSRLAYNGFGAFAVTSLTEIMTGTGMHMREALPSGLITIGELAFSDTHMIGITIPESVEIIGRSAFRNARLHTLNLEGGSRLRHIGSHAFAENPNLMNFTIPRLVTYVGWNAFRDTYPNLAIYK